MKTKTQNKPAKAIRGNSTINDVIQVIPLLTRFINRNQLKVLSYNCQYGEEKQYFRNMLCELARRIEGMPATYQNQKGAESIVYLHYFKGGCDWWITEKDKGSPKDDPADKGKQYQAFGRANLGYSGELGYISIEQLKDNNVEIDLYWTPKPLKECKS